MDSAPRRIGRYAIERELGRGGMGRVLVGRDPALGRRVAIKLPLGDAAELSATQRERFLREGEVLARLRHPGVVTVHEVGFAGQRPFLVMELVDGEGLDAALERDGPLEAERAARYVAQAARAVAAAHEAGVLHRDLKPANLLVTGDDRVVVTDLGLARDLADARERLTRTGEVLGTPGFMAPEQAGGEGGVDERADVYGLGATLYALLTGSPPFEGPTLWNVVHAVLSAPPAPPRRRRPELPAALEAICLRCLAKDPEERHRSAAALAEELERFARGEAVDAGPGRSPRRLALASALLAAAIAGAVGLALAGRPVGADPDEAATLAAGAARAASAREGLERAVVGLPERPDLEALDGLLGALARARAAQPGPAASSSPAAQRLARAVQRAQRRAAREAARLAEELEAAASPRQRASAAQAWLERFPAHPAAPRVTATLARDRTRFPGHAWSALQNTCAVLTGDGRAVTAGYDAAPGEVVVADVALASGETHEVDRFAAQLYPEQSPRIARAPDAALVAADGTLVRLDRGGGGAWARGAAWALSGQPTVLAVGGGDPAAWWAALGFRSSAAHPLAVAVVDPAAAEDRFAAAWSPGEGDVRGLAFVEDALLIASSQGQGARARTRLLRWRWRVQPAPEPLLEQVGVIRSLAARPGLLAAGWGDGRVSLHALGPEGIGAPTYLGPDFGTQGPWGFGRTDVDFDQVALSPDGERVFALRSRRPSRSLLVVWRVADAAEVARRERSRRFTHLFVDHDALLLSGAGDVELWERPLAAEQ